MKKAIITSVPFATIMTIFFYFFNSKGTVSAIIAGLLSAAIYIVFLRLMARLLYNNIKKLVLLKPYDNEEIIFESPANHFMNKEAVGGLLCFTNQRIVFQSHNLNIQNDKWEIKTTDITRVSENKKWGIIPNGLLIETGKKNPEKFVVDEPDKWVRLLNQIIEK
jgi:hypothetical protein